MSKKDEKKLGYSSKDVKQVLKCRFDSGEQLTDSFLFETKVPKGVLDKLVKALKVSRNWDCRKDKVQYMGGTEYRCVISNGPELKIRDEEGAVFFGQIIHIDLFDRTRYVYFFPYMNLGKLAKVQYIQLDEAQRGHALKMAKELDNVIKMKKIEVQVKSLAKKTLRRNAEMWQEPVEENVSLPQILTEFSWVWDVLVAMLDIQMRPMIVNPEKLPQVCRVLVCPTEQNRNVVMEALKALTVINEQGNLDQGPIVWDEKCDSSAKGVKRLFLWNHPTSDAMKQQSRRISQLDQARKSGGRIKALEYPYYLAISTRTYTRPGVVELTMGQAVHPLSDEQMDCLRSAVLRFLKGDVICRLCVDYGSRCRSQISYRTSRQALWWEVIIDGFCAELGIEKEIKDRAIEQVDREKQEAEVREKRLQKAIDLLSDPANYRDKLEDKPASKEQAESLFKGSDFLGFRHIFSDGTLKKKETALFRGEHLQRWLGMSKEELPSLFESLSEEGILLEKNKNVSFGGKHQIRMHVFAL